MGIFKLVEPTDIKSQSIHQLFQYWQSKCGPSRLPAKADIDPAEIKPLLPYITLTEIHRSPFRVRFRLVGTEIARKVAVDFTDTWLPNAGWSSEIELATLSVYQQVIDRAEPIFGIDDLVWNDGRHLRYEWGKFPLTSGGESVTHTIGLEDHGYPSWDPVI